MINNLATKTTALLLGMAALLSACAPVQQTAKQVDASIQTIYPPPPDDPRFVYERTIHGSADVVPPDDDFALRNMLTGERITSSGLAKPYAIAVHQGRIFVSDTVERLVKVFDIPEGRYFTIGQDDNASLVKPLGLDVDRNGVLYVADIGLNAIMIFDRDGNFLRKIAKPREEKLFDRLTSVSVDPAGTRLYVVDIGGVSSENHRVLVFDAKTGEHLYNIGTRGTGPGELNLPRDAVVGKDGRLYVVDGGNFRVQIFDSNGKYLHSFGKAGKLLGDFSRPKEISVDPDGNVYIIDAGFGNFQIFNAEGEMLMYLGERSDKDRPGRFMLPSGIAVDEDGRVYAVDQWFRKIDIFRPYGLQPEDGYLAAKPKSDAKK